MLLVGIDLGPETAPSRTPVRRPVYGVESLELLGDQSAAVFRDGSEGKVALH